MEDTRLDFDIKTKSSISGSPWFCHPPPEDATRMTPKAHGCQGVKPGPAKDGKPHQNECKSTIWDFCK